MPKRRLSVSIAMVLARRLAYLEKGTLSTRAWAPLT